MNDEVRWFNQIVLAHRDKSYASDGLLRVSVSTNSEDYKYFNSPTFHISVSNQYNKTCVLNIQNAEDLLDSFTNVLKQLNGSDVIVEKAYQKNMRLYFKFAMTSSNERVVVIELISGETDVTKVIIPLKPTFQSFIRRLKAFVEQYDTNCFNLLQKTIYGEQVNIINQLPTLIKGIASQIVSTDYMPSSPTRIPDEIPGDAPFDTSTTEKLTADLDKFLGDDLKNIKIDEIEEEKIEKKDVVVEIKSDFVEKILKNDLVSFENKMISYSVAKMPFMEIVKEFNETLDINLLLHCKDDEIKSMVYLSTLISNLFVKSYTLNDTPIPPSFPFLKFNGKRNNDILELSKDLIMIAAFYKAIRGRLETKIPNAYDNKSMVYMLIRVYMDSLYLSYLDGISKSELVSSVKNRYLHFEHKGLFNRYFELLKDNNCPPISVDDILYFVEEVHDKVIGKVKNVFESHKDMYDNNNVALPNMNQLNLEQIVNKLIPLEIAVKMGLNIKDKDVKKEIKLTYPEEVYSYFLIDKAKQAEQSGNTIKMKKVTPLSRWVDKFKQDIPTQYRDEFVSYINELEYGKFDFKSSKWPLDEFDEKIIKGLYCWNPDIDENIKSNFEHFASIIENDPMTKDAILITNKAERSSDWDAITNFV